MKNKLMISKNIKGFLDPKEGKILYKIAKKASKLGPCMEIGSYCGKSSIYIGNACKEKSNVLFSIDHHKGSEEQQPGEDYFDSLLFDFNLGRTNSLNSFIKNISKKKLNNTIIPIINKSNIISKFWNISLSLIFIDGSHDQNNILNDYECWNKHIIPEGFLIFHDIFKNKNHGGNQPYNVYKIAKKSDKYKNYKIIKTLGILQRKK